LGQTFFVIIKDSEFLSIGEREEEESRNLLCISQIQEKRNMTAKKEREGR